MNGSDVLPRILVIDDLFGRTVKGLPHKDRMRFCRNLGILDVTGDCDSSLSRSYLGKKPVAEAVFCRGQKPLFAQIGDVVENDLEGTLKLIKSGWDEKPVGSKPWALIVLDMCFYTGNVTEKSESTPGLGPGMPETQRSDSDPGNYFGLTILRAIQEKIDSQLPVVILSSMDPEQTEHEWVHGGAVRFIERNADDAAEQLDETLQEVGLFPDSTGKIKGNSLPILKALKYSRNIAKDEHVLLLGETGTGKDLFAHYIHDIAAEPLTDRPLVVVDLQNTPSDFVGTELFGYRRAAPVHARARAEDYKGAFERANGGDLFLDEIGSVPKDEQSKLLRAIQFGLIRPLGADSEIEVNVRVIAATDADPETLLPQLLARFHHPDFKIPSLRDRKDDIPILVEFFLKQLKDDSFTMAAKKVEPDAVEILKAYNWPKNVRDLKNVLRRSAMGDHRRVPRLAVNHLPSHIASLSPSIGTGSENVEDELQRLSTANDESIEVSHETDSTKIDLSGNIAGFGTLAELQLALLAYLNSYVEKSRDPSQPLEKQLSGTRAYRLMLPEEDKEKVKNPTIKGASLFKKLVEIHPATTRSALKEYHALAEIWEWIETRGGARKKPEK